MDKEHYISPFSETIDFDVEGVMAASPVGMEGISSSGNVIEWEWDN